MKKGLALELLKVTERAALAVLPLIGTGDKIAIDQAAVDTMKETFATINIKGRIAAGEGAKDKAPGLHIEEEVGHGGSEFDIAVDPIEGTDFVAKGVDGAYSVLAVAEKGSLLNVPDIYMNKIVVGPEGRGVIDLKKTPTENLGAVAKAKGKAVSDLTVAVLDRSRHKDLITELKEAGANLELIPGGDLAWGIATALKEVKVDLLMGVGGAPEGILTAAAVKCLGGDMQVQLIPRNKEERQKVLKLEFKDVNQIFTINDLVRGEEIIFLITGVTEGILLEGVEEGITHSILMRKKRDNNGSYIRKLETDYSIIERLKIS